MAANTLNLLLFAMLPYVALFLFFLGTIMRYRKAPFTYSSLSSQFLENQQHFWAMVAFHYGVILILLSHLIDFLFASQIMAWNRSLWRLYATEVLDLSFALMTLVGLVGILERRVHFSRARRVTSPADWLIEALLALQVIAGIYIAVFHPWGSAWFPASISPYLWSIFKLSPDVSYLATMPFVIKLHMVNAWLIILLFPFTRLVHILVAPFPYLWRKPQLVRWYGIRLLPARGPRISGAKG